MRPADADHEKSRFGVASLPIESAWPCGSSCVCEDWDKLKVFQCGFRKYSASLPQRRFVALRQRLLRNPLFAQESRIAIHTVPLGCTTCRYSFWPFPGPPQSGIGRRIDRGSTVDPETVPSKEKRRS